MKKTAATSTTKPTRLLLAFAITLTSFHWSQGYLSPDPTPALVKKPIISSSSETLFEKEQLLQGLEEQHKQFQIQLQQEEATTTTTTTTTELERLSYNPNGHKKWTWKKKNSNGQQQQHHTINYIEMGDPTKPALLLIHGFGVNSYHFRSNIPELAKNYHVFAFDMLGFGSSSMPIQDYSPKIWRDQTIDFIEQVIQKPTAVAGNSLGGLIALYAASAAAAATTTTDKRQTTTTKPSLVSSVILLNAALRFRHGESPLIDMFSPPTEDDTTNNNKTEPKEEESPILGRFLGQCQTFFMRHVLGASFEYTKQPKNIKTILRRLYPVQSEHVDEDLIQSILTPSADKNAAEIYYRVMMGSGPLTKLFADDMLKKLDIPLLLCWGTQDPWFKVHTCDKIQSLYTCAQRVDINAGHCAHDEAPMEVNHAIHSFLSAQQQPQVA